jgi:hypothetical protein
LHLSPLTFFPFRADRLSFTFNLNDLFVDSSTLANGQAQTILPSYAIPPQYMGRGTGSAPSYPPPNMNANPNFEQNPKFGNGQV